MSTYLRGLIAYNNWATQSLLEFLVTLPPETLDLTTPGVYGTVRETLAHMLTSEINYQRTLAAAPYGDRLRQPKDADLALLQQMAADSANLGARFDIAGRPPDDMVRTPDGMRARGTIVTQLLTHAAEHRTHIATILGAHGIPLPELDSWAHGIFAGQDDWPTAEWGPEPPDRAPARFTIR